MLQKKKDYEKAIDFYSQAIELEPNDHVLYSNRSACYININKAELAYQDGKKCVALNPTWWKGFHKQGLAEFSLGKFDEALISYEKALELDKDNQTVKTSIIELEQKKERRKQSIC